MRSAFDRPVAPSHTPAALGAPPGEEFYEPRDRFDWETTSQASELEDDSASQIGGVPGQYKSLAADTRALLEKYLPEEFPPEAPADHSRSLLFKDDRTARGIPLSANFKQVYKQYHDLPSPSLAKLKPLAREFTFTESDQAGFFARKTLSPDLLLLGSRLGVNFKSQNFRKSEKFAFVMETRSRSALRLTAYLGTLLSLNARAQELNISEQDRAVLQEALLSLTGSLWTELSISSSLATDARQRQALYALGIAESEAPGLLAAVPADSPFLLGGKVSEVVQNEIDARKQATELAKNLKASKPKPHALPSQYRIPKQGGFAASVSHNPVTSPVRDTTRVNAGNSGKAAVRGRGRGRGRGAPRGSKRV